MAEWFFRKKSKGEVERDPGWDEYFTSNRSTDESLVREAIQNSLDAHAKSSGSGPAHVRIYYAAKGKALSKDAYAKYLKGAKEHYAAEECKVDVLNNGASSQIDLFEPEEKYPYVVIEDFNTIGLVGDIAKDYTNEKKKPPYYRFFWSENQSEKGEGTRGKWGIGKVVFPIASRLRTFFAYSVRADDSPREILCGKALLSYHTVDGERYSADGWWGCQKNGDAMPETDPGTIAAFKVDFNLARKDEPGLSVVVPYVKELDWTEMQRVLVENYMVAIVRGELAVELENDEGEKIFYDAAHLESIEAFLAQLAESDKGAKTLLQAFQMICEGLTAPKEFRVGLYEGDRPEWQDGIFNENMLSQIRDELDKTENGDETGNPVTIVVPMRVAPKRGERKEGEFKVVLRRSPGASAHPWFYRAGLYINRVRPHAVSNFVAVVLIDGVVSDMLNQAEPPSHSEWRVLTGDFKSLYKYAGEHIDFVIKSVRRLVDRIDETEKGLDRTTLKNIFFVSRQNRLATLKHGKGAGKGTGTGGAKEAQESGGATDKNEVPNFTDFAEKPKSYMIYPVKDGEDSGVAIKANDKEFKPTEVNVSFFYETLSGKVKFNENDFSFLKKGSLAVSYEPAGLVVEYPAANRVRIKADESSKDFKLTIRGFDANRDLRVIARSEDLKEDGDGA